MPTSRRLLWLLTLLVFLTGCTTYRTAVLPSGDPRLPEPDPDLTVTVRAGMTVKLTLRSGEQLTSEVARVTPTEIIVGKPSNYGWQERVIPAAEIDRLEVQRPTLLGSILFTTVGTVLLVSTALILIIAISLHNADLGGLS